MTPTDLPDRLLAAVVRLLPPRRAAWGRAMRAELAAVEAPGQRWRFALGCARATLTSPPAVATLAGRLVAAAVAACAAALAWGIPAPGLRAEALVVVAGLAVVAWSGARRFGPAAPSPAARAVRAGVLALVGTQVLLAVVGLRLTPPDGLDTGPRLGDATVALAVWSALMAAYLVALVGISASADRVVLAGATAGGGAALLWTVACVMVPGVPASSGPALVAMLAAGLVGAAVARRAGRLAAATAGLCAAMTTALLVDLVIEDVLPLTGRWVSTSHAPVYPFGSVDRLVDPIGILLVGAVAALGLALAVSVRSRRAAA